MNVKVTTASGIEESLLDAPAAMVVIEESDFKKRGYISLVEILADLPGFDSVITSGATHLTFYQRGYRTPASSRTLFMINGVINNHLWTQIAVVSRQYPISNISRVELLYGPSSVRYGPNAFMGVINIISKNADDLRKGTRNNC
jgi:outer membrane receptor for ferrienterochelin and colicins